MLRSVRVGRRSPTRAAESSFRRTSAKPFVSIQPSYNLGAEGFVLHFDGSEWHEEVRVADYGAP